MADRYFIAEPIQPGSVTISGVEAHHLLHVMRAKAGDQVVLFDGSGAEFPAIVESTARNSIQLRAGERLEIDRECSRPLTLAVSLPKGDRQKWLIEKVVELGISRVIPLTTARSVAQPTDSALEKLRRAVIEASKQCGRNRLMEITEPQSADQFLPQPNPTAFRLIAHPKSAPGGEESLEASDLLHSINPTGEIVIAVGPEGGFTEAEVSTARAAGWHCVELGPRILRVETAAICLAVLAASLDPPR